MPSITVTLILVVGTTGSTCGIGQSEGWTGGSETKQDTRIGLSGRSIPVHYLCCVPLYFQLRDDIVVSCLVYSAVRSSRVVQLPSDSA